MKGWLDGQSTEKEQGGWTCGARDCLPQRLPSLGLASCHSPSCCTHSTCGKRARCAAVLASECLHLGSVCLLVKKWSGEQAAPLFGNKSKRRGEEGPALAPHAPPPPSPAHAGCGGRSFGAAVSLPAMSRFAHVSLRGCICGDFVGPRMSLLDPQDEPGGWGAVTAPLPRETQRGEEPCLRSAAEPGLKPGSLTRQPAPSSITS